MNGKLTLSKPYIHITHKMEWHALIEYTLHQALAVRRWVWKSSFTGKQIPGQGYVVGEIYQMENMFPFLPRRDCEVLRRYDKL